MGMRRTRAWVSEQEQMEHSSGATLPVPLLAHPRRLLAPMGLSISVRGISTFTLSTPMAL